MNNVILIKEKIDSRLNMCDIIAKYCAIFADLFLKNDKSGSCYLYRQQMHADIINILSYYLSIKSRNKLRRLSRNVLPYIAICYGIDVNRIIINAGFYVKYYKYKYTLDVLYHYFEYYKYGYDKKLFYIEKNYIHIYNTIYIYIIIYNLIMNAIL